MDEARFWPLLEAARLAADGDCDAMHDSLQDSLMTLSLDEIVEFDKIISRLLDRANRFDLKAAYFIMTGSGSYDGLTYFRSWLIGQGQDTYNNALAQPDSLADVDLGEEDDAECEQLAYTALHAYEAKTGKEMHEYPIEHKQIKGHRSHYSQVNRMLTSGVNVNCSNPAGNTPLIIAVLRKDHPMTALLLRAGAQVNQQNKQGLDALYTAVTEDDVPIAQQLIAKGANVNRYNKKDHTTALMAAIHGRDLPMIALFVKSGADVNAQSNHGITPLWFAMRLGLSPAVALLQKGATYAMSFHFLRDALEEIAPFTGLDHEGREHQNSSDFDNYWNGKR